MDILVPGSRLGLAPLCTPLVCLYVCTVMNVSLEFAHLSVHIVCSLHAKIWILLNSMTNVYMHLYHVRDVV